MAPLRHKKDRGTSKLCFTHKDLSGRLSFELNYNERTLALLFYWINFHLSFPPFHKKTFNYIFQFDPISRFDLLQVTYVNNSILFHII